MNVQFLAERVSYTPDPANMNRAWILLLRKQLQIRAEYHPGAVLDVVLSKSALLTLARPIALWKWLLVRGKR